MIPANFSVPRRTTLGFIVALFYLVAMVNLTILFCKNNSLNSATVNAYLAKLNNASNADLFMKALREDSLIEKMLTRFRKHGNYRHVRRFESSASAILQRILCADLRSDLEQKYAPDIKYLLKNEILSSFKQPSAEASKFSFPLYRQLREDYISQNLIGLQSSLAVTIDKVHSIDIVPFDELEIRSALIRHNSQRKLDWYHEIIVGILIKHQAAVEPFSDSERGVPLMAQKVCHFHNPPLSYKKLLGGHMEPKSLKLKMLQLLHRELVEAIKKIPDPPFEDIHGDGIVIAAYGGSSLGSALVAVAQLRELRSRLPIEVVVAREADFDSQICDDLLPSKFNAHCVVIEREVGVETLDFLPLNRDQLKVFALLFTSFDNTVYIDAETMVLKNVDLLLYLEPFLLGQFVLWPDVWHRTTSPYFYEIAGIQPGFPVRRDGAPNMMTWSEYASEPHMSMVALYDLAGTMPAMNIESGQMLFSRRRHYKSLLLAIYYTLNGPTIYWPLLSQDRDGGRNHDTFLPALLVMQEPYHIVETGALHVGHYRESRSKIKPFAETAIVLYDPTMSAHFFKDWQRWLVETKRLGPNLNPFQCNQYSALLKQEFLAYKNGLSRNFPEQTEDGGILGYSTPQDMFLHPLEFKINPATLLRSDGTVALQERHLGPPSADSVDWELKFYSIAAWMACTGIESPAFWAKFADKNRTLACNILTDFKEKLVANSPSPGSQNLDFVERLQ